MPRPDPQLIVTIAPTAKASAAWLRLWSKLLSADASAPGEGAELPIYDAEEPHARLVVTPKMRKEPGGQDG